MSGYQESSTRLGWPTPKETYIEFRGCGQTSGSDMHPTPTVFQVRKGSFLGVLHENLN